MELQPRATTCNIRATYVQHTCRMLHVCCTYVANIHALYRICIQNLKFEGGVAPLSHFKYRIITFVIASVRFVYKSYTTRGCCTYVANIRAVVARCCSSK